MTRLMNRSSQLSSGTSDEHRAAAEERRGEAAEPVDEHEDPRQRVVALVVRAEVLGAGRGQQVAAAIELGVEHGQVTGHRLEVVAGGDVDDLRQRGERTERARPEVEADDDDLVGPAGDDRRHGERAQHRRLAGAARAEHEPPGPGLEVDERRELVLALRGVDQADGHRLARLGAGRLGARIDEHVGERERSGSTSRHGVGAAGRREAAVGLADRPAGRRRGGCRMAVVGPASTFGESSVRTNGATRTGAWTSSLTSGEPQYAAWKATRARGPRRTQPRPFSGTGISAASALLITATDSLLSSMRSEMRRLVLARMLSLTAPDGRCVARIRWMPRLRPRWAMSTMPSTNSGTSLTSVANSSTTMTSDGGASSGCSCAHLGEVLGLALEQAHAPVQLGPQRRQRPPRQLGVEVGDVADGVRQLGEHGARRAALVVDEEERQPGRRVAHGERGDDRLQQLALAGARRAADQRVRPVGDEVEA